MFSGAKGTEIFFYHEALDMLVFFDFWGEGADCNFSVEREGVIAGGPVESGLVTRAQHFPQKPSNAVRKFLGIVRKFSKIYIFLNLIQDLATIIITTY